MARAEDFEFDAGEIDRASRDEIVTLEFADIDQCDDVAQLHTWYAWGQELADDVVAQIEANKITEMRDDQWVFRASGMLIGLKKKLKRIERFITKCSRRNSN